MVEEEVEEFEEVSEVDEGVEVRELSVICVIGETESCEVEVLCVQEVEEVVGVKKVVVEVFGQTEGDIRVMLLFVKEGESNCLRERSTN